jgi:dephospho-CoA kinase
MIKVGLTGGIGSGKTVVCKVFENLGVPVFNADEQAKQITEKDPTVREKIILRFGKGIYTSQGLDRKKLASIVFGDPVALAGLNHIIHPAVREKYEQWLEEHKDSPYTIKEAAIIFEIGSYKEFDKIITVTAPEELRIQRAVQRDKVQPEDVKKRIANQASDEYKMQLSDFVIINDEKKMVIPQVLEVHERLVAGSL